MTVNNSSLSLIQVQSNPQNSVNLNDATNDLYYQELGLEEKINQSNQSVVPERTCKECCCKTTPY